ncbi:helix-turn-helix transcriptional regulator [Ruminococcaceae bacterium OttesenSCG-928-D13]|nr:helix-turn-helix transcriptional regulator [Ruminococcaceae bacterium OttesenSCG-928-D13]
MENHFENFIYLVQRHSLNEVSTPHAVSTSERYYYEILSSIKKHYRTITLAEISAKMHLSKQYLCRVIKTCTDMSFSDLLSAEKISKVKDYLNETDLSLEKIAELTGFSCASYLSRVFKASEGISPSEYREIE